MRGSPQASNVPAWGTIVTCVAAARPDLPIGVLDSRGVIGHYALMAGSLQDSLRTLSERFVEALPAWRPHLDYSLDSGDVLDQFIDEMLATGDPISDRLIMGIGAYLGETFIRNLGGSWAAMPSGPTPDDPGIKWQGLNVLPFEKVRKRIELGPTHSLGFFLRECQDSAAVPPDQRAGRLRRFSRKD